MLSKIKMTICVCVLCAFAIAPIFSTVGEVLLVLGRVEAQNDDVWAPLIVGDTVSSGTLISTGFRSQVVIQVAESTITVDALSRLTLEQLTENTDGHESEIYLDIGSIKASVSAAENKRVSFIVNTPVATAAVRGTEFSIDTRSVWVQSGIVAVTSKQNGVQQKEILVEKGSIVVIEANYLAPPQVTRAAEATTLGTSLLSTTETVGGSFTGGSSESFVESSEFSSGVISNVLITY